MTAAKANLDHFSAKTNASFQADQEDLFGDRPSQDNSALFDERPDGEAGRELIKRSLATTKRNLNYHGLIPPFDM